ncbi:MAG: hypothetical protein IKY67_06155 [Paludibacteraceae bacterium]|nr:hypothetical protein [Paludibacteraceae bacterium]
MKRYIYVIVIISFALISCKREKRRADLTGIECDIKIERFDSLFWGLDTTRLAEEFAKLQAEHPNITPIYTENVVQFGHPDSAITHDTYKLFRSNKEVGKLYEDALKIYADVSDIEKDLTEAFRRAKYFLPQFPTPRVYCHVSGLNQSLIVDEEFISLSIDNYLGADYQLYKEIGIYKYQRPNMRREKVAPDYITAWLSSEFSNSLADNLLSDMIRYGKILYTVSVLLPKTPERVIMGYSEEQWDWVKKNEANMWNALIASKDLYTTSMMIKNQYIGDGPFTKPFTQESPGRAGTYIGWRIVENYMKHNPQISIQQLLQQPDAQMILNNSNYRP